MSLTLIEDSAHSFPALDEEGRRFFNQLRAEVGACSHDGGQPVNGDVPLYDDVASDAMNWVNDDDNEPSDEIHQVHHDLRDLRLSLYVVFLFFWRVICLTPTIRLRGRRTRRVQTWSERRRQEMTRGIRSLNILRMPTSSGSMGRKILLRLMALCPKVPQ